MNLDARLPRGASHADITGAAGRTTRRPANARLGRSVPKTLTRSAASPPSAGAPEFTEEQVEAARTLYIAKCTGCHKFYPPANYSAADWEVWMRKMSRKARLNPEQDALLRAYLELFRR
jgi:hypothetical protein